MAKKKLILNKVTIQSFITSAESAKVFGGETQGTCHFPTRFITCDDVTPGCLQSEFSCGGDTCAPSCAYCWETHGCLTAECPSDPGPC